MIVTLSLHDPDIVEQIWALQHAAYRMEAAAIGLRDVPPLPETFDSLRSSKDTFFGYLSEDDEILGAIAVYSSDRGDEAEITRLMVRQDCLRQGIAAQLMTHVLKNYSNAGVISVTAGTRNLPAVALYRKFGFQPGSTCLSAAGAELTDYTLTRPGQVP